MTSELKRYGDWQPTQFDPKGLALDEQQDWLVLPVIRTRDSEALELSNFATVENNLEEVNPSGEDWEVHRFGHWANGWFEILIVKPDSEAHRYGEHVAQALADYPILDEMDFSEREWEEVNETWKHCYSVGERVALIREHNSRAGMEYHLSIFAARRDEIPQGDTGYIYDRMRG